MWGNMSIIAKSGRDSALRHVRMVARRHDRPRADVQRGAQAVPRIRAAGCGRAAEGKLDEAISIAERNKKSHIAKVVATGLSEFQSASSQVRDVEVIEAAKRGLDRSVAIVHAEMKRGLSGLATIGSTAPFVGLFGTVVGIINAFKGIETTQGDRVVGGRRRYFRSAGHHRARLARCRACRVGVQLLHQQG